LFAFGLVGISILVDGLTVLILLAALYCGQAVVLVGLGHLTLAGPDFGSRWPRLRNATGTCQAENKLGKTWSPKRVQKPDIMCFFCSVLARRVAAARFDYVEKTNRRTVGQHGIPQESVALRLHRDHSGELSHGPSAAGAALSLTPSAASAAASMQRRQFLSLCVQASRR
jgi:hypothetical protein